MLCLQDGPALYLSSLRALADSGRLRTAVVAKDGRTLNLGRSRRTVSSRQLLVLWQRDHGCTVPGCGRVRFLHAHHVTYWTHGGGTDLDNLVLLCGEHHRALHDGKFTIRTEGHQQFAFHRPDGTVWPASPPIDGSTAALRAAHLDLTPETVVPDRDGTPPRLSPVDR